MTTASHRRPPQGAPPSTGADEADEAAKAQPLDEAAGDPACGVEDSAAERRLCLKLDVRVLPMLAAMYLCNGLDKGNLGNAQTNGLGKDLGFREGQYNLVVAIFFVPFVVLAPPLALLSKRLGAARALAVMTLAFGSMTLLTAATRDFGGLFALRWLLGMAEGAFFPVAVYYLTTLYRRGELARRLAVFYAASNLAGAFSGLLAFAVFSLPASRLAPWRYLFLLEGGLTVVLAAAAWLWLPAGAAQAAFLDPAERRLARRRIETDSSAGGGGGGGSGGRLRRLRDALRVLAHPTALAFLAIEVCVGVPLQSVALFLPQIVARLGFSPVTTNLYTVAPSATGAAMLLLLAFGSDLTRLRSPFIVVGFVLTLAGFAVYAAVDDVAAQPRLAYAATFMMCWGTSAPSVLLSTWYNNNIADDTRRLTLTAIGVPLANLMGLVAGNMFRERDAPQYRPALITAAGFGAAGALVTAGLGLYMLLDNRRRNRRAGVRIDARHVSTHRLRAGPRVDAFRWFL